LFAAFVFGWLAILAPVGAQTISVGSFPLNPVPSYLPPLPLPPPEEFYVPVEISGAVSLQNWQFSLKFDNTVVQEVDPLDGSSGIYGAEFIPGDATSLSNILAGFPLPGVVDGVAGSYPFLLNGPSGDGVLADILFEFLPGQEGKNPNFSITNAVVLAPVPAPEAGSLGLLAGLALLAGFFAVHRVQREDLVKKSLLAAASAITILASGPVCAQTTMNGPYYANPSWDQQFPAAQRFIVLSNWNNEAVLDCETGLIWQRTPDNSAPNWPQANNACRFLVNTGGRYGWRLPTAEELETLLDPTQQNPALPVGHPFLGVKFTVGDNSTAYWAASLLTETDGQMLGGLVAFNEVPGNGGYRPVGFQGFVWCVRGGSGRRNLPDFP
jgi:hypothetical protein